MMEGRCSAINPPPQPGALLWPGMIADVAAGEGLLRPDVHTSCTPPSSSLLQGAVSGRRVAAATGGERGAGAGAAEGGGGEAATSGSPQKPGGSLSALNLSSHSDLLC